MALREHGDRGTALALSGVALASAPPDGGRAPGAYVALRFYGGAVQEVLDSTEGGKPPNARLLELARSMPVVTASVERTEQTLRRLRAATHAPVWNVLELAGLLAPSCPNDDLDVAARHFGLAREEEGLAGDARLTLGLFARVLAALGETDSLTLQHANRLAAGLQSPLRSFFAEMERLRAREAPGAGRPPPARGIPFGEWLMAPRPPRRRGPPSPPSPETDAASGEAETNLLAPLGALASVLDSYEDRPEQARMAHAVARALEQGDRLLVEAGTGTGKSLAYLVPAARLALREGLRVVVSTATTNLQDQLLRKDVPLITAVLPDGAALKAVVLKGRANYLCLQRWQALLLSDDLEPHERGLLLKTLFWLPATASGDRAELRLSPREEEAWGRVSATMEACTPGRCTFHRIGSCFLARARRAAEDSHIVIVNHALLLTDLASRSHVLPEYQVLVIDEAHHLEDEATSQLGWRIGERELVQRFEHLWNPPAAGRAPGILSEAFDALRGAGRGDLLTGLTGRLVTAERSAVHGLHAVRHWCAKVSALFSLHHIPLTGEHAALRLAGDVRSGEAWSEIQAEWEQVVQALSPVLSLAAEVMARLDELARGEDGFRGTAAELASHLEFWRTTVERVSEAIQGPDKSSVYWLSVSRYGYTWINAAPLEVAEILDRELFSAPHASVLVSATLSVDGSFRYIKQRLGLPEAQAIGLGSPFDHRASTLLYVPYDLPDPTQPHHQAHMERLLVDTITRIGGRTLVLFTSRSHLRATYAGMCERLGAEGITLLGQGIDEGSRTHLLEQFRRGGRVALFGTSAFWEGIDVVGEALSCVVVARLPFAAPTDPIYAARAERFDDPFGEFAVPQAVLKFKQGFGRLIRSRTDRGVVVVLDRRLATRNYGAVFVRSLPDVTVRQGPVGRTGTAVAEWLTPREPEVDVQRFLERVGRAPAAV